MGTRYHNWDEYDDDFAEPNYDLLTDEQLDELYYSGKLSSSVKPERLPRKKKSRKSRKPLFLDGSDQWLDVDFDDFLDYDDD